VALFTVNIPEEYRTGFEGVLVHVDVFEPFGDIGMRFAVAAEQDLVLRHAALSLVSHFVAKGN